MKPESREQLINSIRKHLEKVKYNLPDIDVAEAEKDFSAFWKAYSKLEKHKGICVHEINEIHLSENLFLPLISNKPNSEVRIVDAGNNFYVKVKGISKTWFCLIGKNFFMFDI